MSKQQKQTRKRAFRTNGVSGKNVKQSIARSGEQTRDGEKSASGINYLRLFIIFLFLCLAFAFILLWLKPSFVASLIKQQSVVTAGENKSSQKHSKRDDVTPVDQKGILKIFFVYLFEP